MISDISNKTGTKLSRNIIILALVMIVNVVIIILLTPIGFETCPQSHLKTLGYLAITAIFVGLAMDLASIGLLFKKVKVRLASSLAIVSSVLFFLIISVDRTGSFFSVPIPPAINTLEYLLIAVLIVTLLLASIVYRGISSLQDDEFCRILITEPGQAYISKNQMERSLGSPLGTHWTSLLETKRFLV